MPRPIRVLELRSVRGTGGGPEKTILQGAALAEPADFEITVCYIRDKRDRVFQLGTRAAELGIKYLEVLERHSFDLRIWPQLLTLVKEERIDIIHSHEYKTDFLAFLLSRKTGAIPLSTVHGWSGYSFREQWLYYPIDKRLLKRFPRVIAVSEKIAENLILRGVRPERMTVMLNAIDPQAFKRKPEMRESIRRQLGWKNDVVVIGAVGRLEFEKRFDLLLEAFSAVRRQRPRVHLAVIGEGSLRESLTAQATRLGVSDFLSLLGHRSDVSDLHSAFDVFVQSSETEGTPNAVLEAMALETPLVATDVGGTRELATPDIHGLIVPRHDVNALRDAIENVIRDPSAAARRAHDARRRIEDDLSFEARTRRLEAIYTELIQERGVRHA